MPDPMTTLTSDLTHAPAAGPAPGLPSGPATRIDLGVTPLRAANAALQAHNGTDARAAFEVVGARGAHALAVGLDAPVSVRIDGSTGYYCAGMNRRARVHVAGSAGPGLAENMMSGEVVVDGDASQYAAATARGGLVVVRGTASSRCAISLKGADVVVGGDVGHMSAFMAQKGTLVVLGDAGEALGDSLYEARLYVRGRVGSLGADCVEKEMRPEHLAQLAALLARAGMDAAPEDFRRYGSARRLYNFDIDNAAAY